MKLAEHKHRAWLDPSEYALFRIDGKAFHTYTRGLNRPHDLYLMNAMDVAATHLVENIPGARVAYVQSDEISILVTAWNDGEPLGNSMLWFDGRIDKMVSVSSSYATAAFNRYAAQTPNLPDKLAYFDSRVWSLPTADLVQQYFSWRRDDCVRNSITMAASTHFSHKELTGVNSSKKLDLLREVGEPWEDMDPGFRFGRLITKSYREDSTTFTRPKTGEPTTVNFTRGYWSSQPFEYDALLAPHIPIPGVDIG